MARGITEQDVLEAADALLARGERPTIERVRQELGRGSPNTVNRHLDAWWVSLAQRMQGRNGASTGVALPAALLDLCGRLYAGVREQGQLEAEATLAAGQAEIQAREANLERKKLALDAEKVAAQGGADKLASELSILRARNESLVTERTQLQAEVVRLGIAARDTGAAAQAAQAGAEAAQTAHRAEVQRLRGQWEGNETRWLREIDHLRDEVKLQRAEHSVAVKRLHDQLKEAEGRLATAAKERLRLDSDLTKEREARIAAEATGRATDALVKTLAAGASAAGRRSGRAAKPSDVRRQTAPKPRQGKAGLASKPAWSMTKPIRSNPRRHPSAP